MLGERIATLRKNKKITQTALAEYLGVTQTAIWKYEKGQTEPDIASLIKMADLFDVSVDYLIGRVDVDDVGKVKSTPKEIEHDIEVATAVNANQNSIDPDQQQVISQAVRELIRAEIKKALSESQQDIHQ